MKRTLFALFAFLLILPATASSANFKPGDEVWVRRNAGKVVYHHSGVYIGKNQVVHANSSPMRAIKRLLRGRYIVRVERTSFGSFANGGRVKLGPTRLRFKRAVIVKRALSRVGKAYVYDPYRRNCQHFSSKMVSGRASSPEARKLRKIVLGGLKQAKKKMVRGVKKTAKKAKKKIKKAAKKIKGIFKKKKKKAKKRKKKKKKAKKRKKKKAKWNSARLKNCSKRKVYACVYQGDGRSAKPTMRFWLGPKRVRAIRCRQTRKAFCLVRLLKSSSCPSRGRISPVRNRRTGYVSYKKGRFSLSNRCK